MNFGGGGYPPPSPTKGTKVVGGSFDEEGGVISEDTITTMATPSPNSSMSHRKTKPDNVTKKFLDPDSNHSMKPPPPKKKSMGQAAVEQSLRYAAKAVKINFAKVKNDYRWEELQRIEERRRKILLRAEFSIWRILLSYDGTVVRILWRDASFWVTIGIYVGIRILAYWEDGLPDYLYHLPSDSITVLGGFLSFFLVFWVNQSHSRFFGLYQQSMGNKGRIFDCATMAVTTLPYAQATRLIRYMNAAHAAGYVGLSTVYPSGNYFNYINRTMGLLTEEERARLDNIDLDKGGSCNREIIVWCINEVQLAQKRGQLDNELAQQFRDHILRMRAAMGALYDAKDLPIPFFYVHFIALLTTLYLPLFAATAAIQAGTGDNAHWISGVIRGLVVVLQAVFVLGLRILGQKMSDPYGDDLIDLSVMWFVHFTWLHSNRILNAHFPEEANATVETSLKVEREHIGRAWEAEKPPKPSSGNSFGEYSSGGMKYNFSYDEEGDDDDDDDDVDDTELGGLRQSRIIYNPPLRR